MGDRQIDDLLRQSVLNYRRYHLRDQNDDEGAESGEVEQLRKQAEVAWDTLTAAFEDHGCTEVFFRSPGNSTEEIIRMVLNWKDQIRWPAGFNAHVAILTAGNVKNCTDQIERFWGRWMWPFIKVVRYVVTLVSSILLGVANFSSQYIPGRCGIAEWYRSCGLAR